MARVKVKVRRKSPSVVSFTIKKVPEIKSHSSFWSIKRFSATFAALALVLQFMNPVLVVASPGYLMGTVNAQVTGALTLSISGNASANPWVGSGMNQQHVTIVWGDGNQQEFDIDTDSHFITTSSNSPKTFSTSWTPISHIYATAGIKTILVKVHHSNFNGNEGDGSEFTANVIIPPATLNVIKNVDNTNGGSAVASNFTMSVTGTNVSPTSFPGSEAGTLVSLSAGLYSVSESSVSGYTGSMSSDCSGTIASGQNKICTVTNTFTPQPEGTIVIVKDTVPDGSQDFGFTTTLTPSPFSLDDDADGTLSNTQTFSNVPVGSYSVTESQTSGFDLTGLVCVDPDQGSNVNGATATIDLDNGETVTCTFTNTLKQGGVTVVKVTNPQSSDQEFTFDPSWSQDNFTITGSGSQNFNLDAGDYSVAENSVDGWEQTSATCIDQDDNSVSPNGFTLAPDGSITCTFVNTQHGHLIVNKATDPQGDDTEFSITASGDGTISGSPDAVISSGNPADYEVTPGTYSVAEDPVTGWEETGNTCQDVAVGAGETKNCTITNTKKGHIIVDKVTDPAESSQSFHFSATGSGYDPFDLTDTDVPNNQELEPGTYTVSESSLPANWSVQSVECVYGTQSVGNPITNGKEVVLDAGDTVTCTFTNKFTQPTEPQADVGISKTVNPAATQTGQQVVFTINVINNGPDSALGVVVTDALPSGLSFVSASSTVGSYATSTSEWLVGTLADDQSETLEITATLTATSGTVTNSASAVLDSPTDPDSNNNSDDATVTVSPPDTFTLTLTKNGDGNGTVSGSEGEGQTSTFCALNECRSTDEKQSFVETYASGTVVTLTASPAEGSNFDGSWSGACSGTNPTCQVTMTGNQSVNAHFALNPVTPPSGGGGGGGSSGGGGGGGGGSPVTGTIAGQVFNDANNNSTKDSGEAGLSGWTVYLDGNDNGTKDSGETSVTSDAAGNYSFTNLSYTGSVVYIVREVVQSTWTQTSPSGGKYAITLTSTQPQVFNKDFGNTGGQVLGISTPIPSTPQVLGATTLPRTGVDLSFITLMVLAGLAVVDRKYRLV